MTSPDACGTLLGTEAARRAAPARAGLARHWPAIVVLLLAVGMLLAFQQVVARSVAENDLRRSASAARVEATWRCKLLPTPSDRRICLAQLNIDQRATPPTGRVAQGSTSLEK